MILYLTCIQLRCTCIRNTSHTFGSWCRPLLSWVRSCRSAAGKCRPDSEDVHGRHTENTDGQLACWKLTCSSNQSRIYILRCVSRWSKKIQFYLKLNLVFRRIGWLFSMLSASLMMTKCDPLLVFVRPHASSHCVKAIDLLTLPANVRIWLYLKKRTEADITCWLYFQQDHLSFRTKSIFKRTETAITDIYNRPFFHTNPFGLNCAVYCGIVKFQLHVWLVKKMKK